MNGSEDDWGSETSDDDESTDSEDDTGNELPSNRNSRSQIFFKTDVLKNFAVFAGKQLCWSIF